MKVLGQIETLTAKVYHKLKTKLLKQKEGTKL